MEEIPLRQQGPLVVPLQWKLKPQAEPPRALKTLAQIVDNDLCHRCGSCIGICPTNVLGVDNEDFPVVRNLSACTDCDLCVKVCPGDDFDALGVAKQLFGDAPDITSLHGHFEQAFLSYAIDRDLRQRSTSGGLVSALLISLLERGLIDGAVVIGSDENVLWKGFPRIARTKSEIIEAAKSKYAISPTNVTFAEILKTEGKYALVGLPCQIHGFHNAAKLDRRIRERVVVTVGLFCHAAIEHEPLKLIWDNLGEDGRRAKRFVSRIGKHPGTPHIVFEDGSSRPVYFPKAKGYRPSSLEILNILYRLYTPPRCLTCYDSTSEYADIAVGDPWLPPPSDEINFTDGYSFVLARTAKALQLLRDAEQASSIKLVPLDKDIARTSNLMMAREKRWRAFRVIETLRRQGRAVPDYGFVTPKASGKHFVLTEIHMLSHIFCYLPWGRKVVMRCLFSPLGYSLLWLNFQRRRFRYWRSVQLSRLRRYLKSRRENSSVGA